MLKSRAEVDILAHWSQREVTVPHSMAVQQLLCVVCLNDIYPLRGERRLPSEERRNTPEQLHVERLVKPLLERFNHLWRVLCESQVVCDDK